GFHVRGKTRDAARQVERDARAVEAAGAFAVVLESMPREVAARITLQVRIPTIGIGAGPDCDGQVLVFHDLVGLAPAEGHTPKFVRRYAQLSAEISKAASEFCDDVRSGRFPSDAESYHSAAEVRDKIPVATRS
ncbi:MAG: 3-methyl-2-oxobutanoate hydroxymethyltransferase, partial [Candidatus Acidiferrales bacterium]